MRSTQTVAVSRHDKNDRTEGWLPVFSTVTRIPGLQNSKKYATTIMAASRRQIRAPAGRQCRLRLAVGTGSGDRVTSFTGSLPNRKRWVVCNTAFGHLVTHRQAEENLGRNAVHSQGRIVLEPKPIVEGRLTNQCTTLCP